MPSALSLAAVDLGAESGRVVLGRFDGDHVALQEVHRFSNAPIDVLQSLHWDILRIFEQVKQGLSRIEGHATASLAGIGIDSWAVDFGLLDCNGALLGNPYCYRDPRTSGMIERVVQRVPQVEIYRATGIQFLPINTLYQLMAMAQSPVLQVADCLLMVPDLLAYWLCGERVGEYTNVTTTQLYDLRTSDWSWDIVSRLDLPSRLFPDIVPPGTVLGELLPEVARELGVRDHIAVTAVASHDTASAVLGIPAEHAHFAFISSGTWSLIGVELDRPLVNDRAMHANFTNEGGYGGKIRFLRNVMGLWLLQECRRSWRVHGSDYDYDDLMVMASEMPAESFFDPDWSGFLAPGDMPQRIAERCRASGQRPPIGPAETTACICLSLALKYRWVLEQLIFLTGSTIEAIHIVGGGARNSVLCRLTADICGLPVYGGPVEATALGNVLVQACSRGELASLEEIRTVVRRSTDIQIFEHDANRARWDAIFQRFEHLLAVGHEEQAHG